MTRVRIDGHTITIPVEITHVRHEMDGPGDGSHVACTSPAGRRTWCFHEWTIAGLVMGRWTMHVHRSEREARDRIADRVREINEENERAGDPNRVAVSITVGESWRPWPEAF